jgi:3-hydroxyacyl-CoA dehydrogenase
MAPALRAFETVALVGAGVIGRGWIRAFAPRCRVRIYDPDPAQSAAALRWLDEDLAADRAHGFITGGDGDKVRERVERTTDLGAALENCDWVQESAPERLDIKRALFAELDRRAQQDAILASSTSALDPAALFGDIPGERRCLVAHPFNPPHVIPVVEVLPSPATDPAVTDAAVTFLEACGRTPVRMRRYVAGFLGNRIQAAVIREALHLVETGVADAASVDAVIRDGLALRWATIGNFGANHTNAEGGIAQYFTRYGDAYRGLMADLDSEPPNFDAETLTKVAAAVEAREGVRGPQDLARKRDRMVKQLLRLRTENR